MGMEVPNDSTSYTSLAIQIGTFVRKFTLTQHRTSLGAFLYGIGLFWCRGDQHFQSQNHTNATSHVSWAIPLWYLSAFGQGKSVLSIANSH